MPIRSLLLSAAAGALFSVSAVIIGVVLLVQSPELEKTAAHDQLVAAKLKAAAKAYESMSEEPGSIGIETPRQYTAAKAETKVTATSAKSVILPGATPPTTLTVTEAQTNNPGDSFLGAQTGTKKTTPFSSSLSMTLNQNLELELVLLDSLDRKIDKLVEAKSAVGVWGFFMDFQGLIGAFLTFAGAIGTVFAAHFLQARRSPPAAGE